MPTGEHPDRAVASLPYHRVPLVRVSRRDGDTGPDVWWQRREMVIALLHEECAACARLLPCREPELRSRDVGTVALRGGGAGPDAAAAHAIQRALDLEPGTAHLVVADRYGEVFAVLSVHGTSADTVLDEAAQWLDHIQRQCPE